ncbi:MAG: hypothetical protein GY856_23615 [bacterium]|nr:hypothetical protein [bacterium]
MQYGITMPRRRSIPAVALIAWALSGLWLGSSIATAQQQLPETVARVNGYEVTRAELLAQVQEIRDQALRAGGVDPAKDVDFYREALEILINEILIYEDGQSRGVGAGAEDVDRAVASVRSHYPDDAAFDKALTDNGSDRRKLRAQLRRALTIEMLIRNEIVPKVQITDAAKRAYYETNQEQMRTPERCRVRHIVIRAGAGAQDKSTARAKAQELLGRIRDGADFAELAREHSQELGSREQGGELPWILLTNRNQPFEKAVSGLALGQLSEVVETEMGYHVIELLERRSAGIRSFAEAEADIIHILQRVAVREAIQRRVTTLRATAKIEILI